MPSSLDVIEKIYNGMHSAKFWVSCSEPRNNIFPVHDRVMEVKLHTILNSVLVRNEIRAACCVALPAEK